MEVEAKVKYIRMSPRKIRLVADIIRGLEVNQAIDQLNNTTKKAVQPLEKLINTAVANAVNNFELEKDNLLIKEIRVDEGPTLHRWMPRARGRATPIRKRTSHISLVLGEIVDSGKKEAKKQKIEAPIKLDKKPKQEEGVKPEEKKDRKKEEVEEVKEEKGKKIVDPRGEGHGKHMKVEGKGGKGFVGKIFRRKSG
jgi:large subunit ribosomal protein L22